MPFLPFLRPLRRAALALCFGAASLSAMAQPSQQAAQAALAAQLSQPAQAVQPEPTRPQARLAVLGDSIAQGYGQAVDQWFAVPGSRWQVANWGVVSSGLASPAVYDWTRGAPSLIRQYAPDVLLISIGANDTRAMTLPDGSTVAFGEDRWTREYARRICGLSQLGREVGAQVIIAPPPAFADAKRESQLALIRQIENYCAIKTGARFVPLPAPLSTPALATAPEYRAADGVHMTRAGYRLGAESVLRSALR